MVLEALVEEPVVVGLSPRSKNTNLAVSTIAAQASLLLAWVVRI